MIHDRAHSPFMQSVVQHYPFSMPFSFVSSAIWAGLSLYSGSSYAIIPSFNDAILLYGIGLELKRLKPSPVKIKNHFANKEFSYNNQLAAFLENVNDSTPSLEIYSDDPGIIGLASGHLRGWDYLELRRKYSPLLFLNAQLRKGPRLQSAIKTINQGIRERKIDIEAKLLELHQFLLEANKKIIENNLAASSLLQAPPITIDELHAYHHFPDIIKGNLACSVYLPPSDKRTDFDMVRNFDWPSANELFNRFLRVIYRTKHKDINKPQFVMSWTLPTNPGFTATNGHIVIAMNEVEKSETMRTGPEGSLGQFDLFAQIVENCCTLEEIREYIETHPAASPWILTVTTKHGSGTFELLPRLAKDAPPYRFLDNNHACVVTNNFQDVPESATISCSISRLNKMKETAQLYPNEPWKIAAASASKDTGQTLIAKWSKDGLITQSNIANCNSAIAKDPDDNQFHYDELNVTQYGAAFLGKCQKNLVKSELTSIDIALMSLCRSAYAHKEMDEDISQCMRNIYSQLMFEKSKIELNSPKMQSSLTLEEIEKIANASNKIVNSVLFDNLSNNKKLTAMAEYEKTINTALNTQISQFTDQLRALLGFTLFVGMMAVIGGSSVGLSLFAAGLVWLINNIPAASTLYSASAPLRNAIKIPPNLAFFTQSLANHLKTKIEEERPESHRDLHWVLGCN